MNFSELKTELADRGFTYLSDTRRGQYINRAVKRLDSMYRWPFRESTSSAVGARAISDLGQVRKVRNTSQGSYPLCEASFDDLIEWYGDLTTTGTSVYWYRQYVTGVPNVKFYPVNTSDTIVVEYWKQPSVLTGTNTPDAPAQFHLLYVDMAVQMAYRDADNHAAAESLQVEINRQIFEMIEDLLPQNQPTTQMVGWWGSEDW